MTVELRPTGVACNIQCQYCYQNPQRDAGNVPRSYDLEAMKGAVEREGGPFTLFGGEPLMVPEDDLEALWAWGLERFGSNGIQTNGVLINDDHIRMFHRYQVSVGISIDGPGELNDVRWSGSLERTREDTAKTEAAIERLCREGIPPSLIVTLPPGERHRRQAACPARLAAPPGSDGDRVGPATRPGSGSRRCWCRLRLDHRGEPDRLLEFRSP